MKKRREREREREGGGGAPTILHRMYTKEVPKGEREKIYKCTHTHTHIYILIGKKNYINSRLLQKNEVGKEKKRQK